jgi:hypothetical protein
MFELIYRCFALGARNAFQSTVTGFDYWKSGGLAMKIVRLGLFFVMSWSGAATAAESDAVVAGLQAPAWVEREGVMQPLQAGAVLSSGDRLSTGKGARIVLNMPDESVVKLGEQVQFEIQDLKPGVAEQPFTGLLRVLAGAFRYTTAPSSKLKRRLDIQVGTATIGIRGTDVWGKSGPDQDLVCLLEGKIEISREGEKPVPMTEPLSVYTAAPQKPANALSQVDMPTVQTLALETELTKGQGVMQTDGKYAVYLYSETSEAAAERRRQQLHKDGYAVEVRGAEVNGRSWHRVLLPHFMSAADAKTVRQELADLYGIDDAWIGKTD